MLIFYDYRYLQASLSMVILYEMLCQALATLVTLVLGFPRKSLQKLTKSIIIILFRMAINIIILFRKLHSLLGWLPTNAVNFSLHKVLISFTHFDLVFDATSKHTINVYLITLYTYKVYISCISQQLPQLGRHFHS